MPKSAFFVISFDFIRSKKCDKLSQNTKDAINREISTIAFIFGVIFHRTPPSCKVRDAQSLAPEARYPVLKGLIKLIPKDLEGLSRALSESFGFAGIYSDVFF